MTIESPGQTLRRQANRALRLARGVADQQAAQALRVHATSLFEKAEKLDRGHGPLTPTNHEKQRPAQQQQQMQPGSEDEKE